MKISKHFKDYYDGQQAQAFDSDLNFLRVPTAYKDSMKYACGKWVRASNVPDNVLATVMSVKSPFSIKTPIQGADFGGAKIFFCGKVYSCIYRKDYISGHPLQCFYSLDSLIKALGKMKGYSKLVETLRTQTHLFPAPTPCPLAVENKLAIIIVTGGWETVVYEVNGNLGKYEFYQVMPANQAYQELSMFIGNQAPENNPTVQIEDKYRIPQHGFDKWSFRKMGKNSV